MVDGAFFRILDATGSFLYRAPSEEPSQRIGSVPKGAVLRGFREGPEGWLEVPAGAQGSVWVKVDGALKTDDVNGQKAEKGRAAEGLEKHSKT